MECISSKEPIIKSLLSKISYNKDDINVPAVFLQCKNTNFFLKDIIILPLYKLKLIFHLFCKNLFNLSAKAQIIRVGLTLPEVGKIAEEQQKIFFIPCNFKFLSTIFG